VSRLDRPSVIPSERFVIPSERSSLPSFRASGASPCHSERAERVEESRSSRQRARSATTVHRGSAARHVFAQRCRGQPIANRGAMNGCMSTPKSLLFYGSWMKRSCAPVQRSRPQREFSASPRLLVNSPSQRSRAEKGRLDAQRTGRLPRMASSGPRDIFGREDPTIRTRLPEGM
jgi:hypothetical protein